MDGLIIVNMFLNSKKFEEYNDLLLTEFKKHNIDITISNSYLTIINQSLKVKKPDFVLFLDKDIVLAKHLENMGIRVINSPSAIEICDDKARMAVELEKHDIKMPKTIVAPFTFYNIGYTDLNFIKEIEMELNYPMVVKERRGSFGEQVYLVNSREECVDLIKKTPKGVGFIFQEYIKEAKGEDVRLQVVGDRVIAAVKRKSPQGDFRANSTLGGIMVKYNPTKKEEALALRVAKLLNVEIAGVDLLLGENNEPILCEINSNAHIKNISDATGVNVAGEIVKYILKSVYGKDLGNIR